MDTHADPDYSESEKSETISHDKTELSLSGLFRDFTNMLDIQHKYSIPFIKKLKEHGDECIFDWDNLLEHDSARRACIASFLGKYGMEYWGTPENRERYLMPDSLAKNDVLTYPEKKKELTQILLLLLQKKAMSVTKSRASQSHPLLSPFVVESDLPLTRARDKREASQDSDAIIYEGSRRINTTRPRKRPAAAAAAAAVTRSTETQEAIPARAPGKAALRSSIPHTRTTTSTTGTKNLADESLLQNITAKYRAETYFLVSASNKPKIIAPAWVRYREFESASSFLKHMGHECGLQKAWTANNAQLAAEGAGDSYDAAAAQDIMASVTLEWSGDEVLVRWGKDDDWKVIVLLVQKAWMAKEVGLQGIQHFKIQILLHVKD